MIITLESLIKSDWSVGSTLISQVGKENPYFCLLNLLFSTDIFKRNVIRIRIRRQISVLIFLGHILTVHFEIIKVLFIHQLMYW